MQNEIANARAGLCSVLMIVGCEKIILCRMLSRKSPGDFVAVVPGSVYDGCEIEKAMEFA